MSRAIRSGSPGKGREAASGKERSLFSDPAGFSAWKLKQDASSPDLRRKNNKQGFLDYFVCLF